MWALIAVVFLIAAVLLAVGALRFFLKVVLMMPFAFLTACAIVFLLAFIGGWRI